MRKWSLLLGAVLILGGCTQSKLTPVNPHEQFVATVTIGEPSVQFYSNSCEHIATWSFEEAYTGGTLVGFDQLLLYGNQMTEAHLYEISTGRRLKTLNVAIGTTNSYFDEKSERLFMTNSKTNELTMYNVRGEKLGKQTLRNYPMSMNAADGLLYVVNYKDTVLSVIDIASFQVVEEWAIPQDSHGLLVKKEQQELWVGGHGAGSTPNSTVRVFDLETGIMKEELYLPMMPVGFAAHEDGDAAIISHGNSHLYVVDEQKEVKVSAQIGSNPFAIAYVGDAIVLAGYDDDTLYVVEDGQVTAECTTLDGPFQLLVRGA